MSTKEPCWFPRFGDMPDVRYAAPSGADFSKLKHRNARPQVHRYPGLPPSMWWSDTSQSPASAHVLDDPRKVSTARVLTNLAEALELPGEPADYHFAIQGLVSLLLSRRQEGLQIFAEIERLCWLDLQLIQSCPDAVAYDNDGQEYEFFSVTAFRTLIGLYLTEGALGDAVRVANIADRFKQGEIPAVKEARERFAAVIAEDGAG